MIKLKKKNGKMVKSEKEEYDKKKKPLKKPASTKSFSKSKNTIKKGGSYGY